MAIFAPEEIKIDILELLCLRGGSFMYPYFMTPYGYLTWAKHTKNCGLFHHYDREKMLKPK